MPKGGYREGSGRKKITENRLDIKLYMRVSEEEQLLIKEKANQNNISVAEYIRQAVLDKKKIWRNFLSSACIFKHIIIYWRRKWLILLYLLLSLPVSSYFIFSFIFQSI
ncbi:hypothetical protein OFR99_14725 [Brachyspira hyodysenteriae]|uniref:DUF6290 family protein n=1 Tax=Brachyspira hyodysenteriae TaxID=159 RepID=UPI0022CDD669|nr:hypothetical protein [Brachyspira hyodysenteriae]MDA0076401.1 hypothetical protein [Brachyspira hyodysenteriae]